MTKAFFLLKGSWHSPFNGPSDYINMRGWNPFMVYCIWNRINMVIKNTCLCILPINAIIFFFFYWYFGSLDNLFWFWRFRDSSTVWKKSIFMIYSVHTCKPFTSDRCFAKTIPQHKISATNCLFLLLSLVSLKAPSSTSGKIDNFFRHSFSWQRRIYRYRPMRKEVGWKW